MKSLIILFWPLQPVVCLSWALSMTAKLAFAKHTVTSRRKHCRPSLTTTRSPNPSVTLTTAAQSHSAIVRIHIHPCVIMMTHTQRPIDTRKSLFLRDDTVKTCHLLHSHTGLDVVKGSITTVRRTTTSGTGTYECINFLLIKTYIVLLLNLCFVFQVEPSFRTSAEEDIPYCRANRLTGWAGGVCCFFHPEEAWEEARRARRLWDGVSRTQSISFLLQWSASALPQWWKWAWRQQRLFQTK